MTGGTLAAQREVIGDEGSGSFIQHSGVNVAQESLIVGKGAPPVTPPAQPMTTNPPASSNAIASNTIKSGFGAATSGGGGVGGDESAGRPVTAAWVSGTYEQLGGKVVVLNPFPTKDPSKDPNGLHLGEFAGATGTYVLADGTLSADPQLIGKGGSGTVTQSGGTNVTGAVVVGADSGSSGTYDMTGGELIVKPRDDADARPEAAIKIGGAGKGRFEFGSASRTGAIYEVGGGASSVVVRGEPQGDGVLSGFGPVRLSGALVNNGRIEADGYRHERDLDLTRFAYVTSSIENPRWGGTSGWYARREGRLKLPAVEVQRGDGTYTWGEDAGDPMIDLVNSVRFTIRGAEQAGSVEIALNSPVRDDLPKLPEGHRFIGVWSFDGSSLGGFDSVELSVRYDDALARLLGLDEELLKLWQYDSKAGAWQRIDDPATFYRNSLDHILTATAGGDLTYFAVSAPEPGGAALLLLVGSSALLGRRRRPLSLLASSRTVARRSSSRER
jgi:hypothetical protein